ncbi:MAG TPA: kelch repeat-containing protein [Chloroflexota bacterium]|nr:kelch repeat-containing protein [Chloroflexota bacterium]
MSRTQLPPHTSQQGPRHAPHGPERAPVPYLELAGALVLLLALLSPIGCGAAEPPGSWRPLPAAPVARFEAQGAVVDGKLYLFGGFYNSGMNASNRSEVYDPATRRWTRLADMPEPVTHAAVAADGTTIYFLGGYVGRHPGGSTPHVWKYDVLTNTWSPGPDLPAPRGAGGATIVGRNLHFFGGTSRTTGTTEDPDQPHHYVLSLNGGSRWEERAPLPNPRNHLGAVTLGGKIYAIGGQHAENEGTSNQSTVNVYDPSSDSWSEAAGLPVPRGHIASSTFVVNDRIMVIGGSINDGGCCGLGTAEVSLYDPTTDVWARLPDLPTPRKSPVAALVGNEIIVTTGNPGDATPRAESWSLPVADRWDRGVPMPMALGEVAGGVIGKLLYVVGEGSPATLAYDLSSGSWLDPGALAQRPFPGNHHAAEVYRQQLYLFGGLGGGEGKVQIYDPATNRWRLGADMPIAAGSSSSALIGDEIYVVGGIVDVATTNVAAKYSPGTNTWTVLAPMKQGRNHAAAATDGRRLYVFGGRGQGSGEGNFVANGFGDVQIYDPASDSWTSSADPASTLAPLPQARGGMGRAVYANGEFYVIGGETQNGPGATRQGVYHRVDIYNPRTNAWRTGSPLPTARHGIAPVLFAGRIYVAGGGVRAGASASNLLEIYTPPLPSI